MRKLDFLSFLFQELCHKFIQLILSLIGLKWFSELTPLYFFLVWRCWDDRSHIGSWYPIIPTWIDLPDLLHEIYSFLEWEIKFYDVSWIFFSYVSFFISWFVARHGCRSWMRRNHAKKWNWFTCPTCVSFSLKTNFFLLSICLSELFSVICIIFRRNAAQNLAENVYKGSLKLKSPVLFTCE